MSNRVYTWTLLVSLFIFAHSPACAPNQQEESPNEHTTEATQELTTETTSETTPEVQESAGESTHEPAQEAASEQLTDTSEPTQDASPEFTAEPPEVMSESAPELLLEPTQETITETPTESPTDTTTNCKQAGEIVGAAESCCSGLSKGALSADALCMPPAVAQICVKCGDGVCDHTQGEDKCSCPKDCVQSAPSGACYPKQSHPFTCPDGKQTSWCECDGKAPCIPECRYIGTRSEGWYDSCDGTRFKWDFCSQCKGQPVCDKIGSKSEGWYCDGALITYAQCAKPTATWSCIKSPENGCTRCQSDKDCTLTACSQHGTYCLEWRETCGTFNLCAKTKTLHNNKTCDTKTGTCQ